MLVVSIIFCLVAGSAAVFVEPGPCPKVTVNKINLTETSGVWIKYGSIGNEADSEQSNVELECSPPENGQSTFVITSLLKNTGDVLKIVSKVAVNDEVDGVDTDLFIPILGRVKRTYWNVALNPNSYSVSWACENQGPNHMKTITLYTRERNPPKEVLLEAQQESEKNGVLLSGLIKCD